jgi:hypothetical protein
VTIEVDDENLLRKQEPVMVFDMGGQLLYRKPLTDTHEQIDLSSYPSGAYLVKIGRHIGKVVKK